MKVIIAGSRNITDYEEVCRAILFSNFDDISEVVSGKAKGVDTLGERFAKEFDIPLKEFPAKWRPSPGVYDKAAGIKRNVEMANYADALIALWDGKSPGTKHMISIAEKKGLKVYVHLVKEKE
jgi:hypothetical protein